MPEIHADTVPNPGKGKPTNFPVVPLAEIPASGSIADAGASRPLVLVADSEPAVADALVEILNRSGYAAIAAYDGGEALETALLVPPELVIANVELPGISAIELAFAVKSELPNCKILLLAGEKLASDLAETAGPKGKEFDVIRKPYSRSDLIARVAASFESKGKDSPS
ncbi:MAG: response regulator [Terracidiphilus sp.]|jgi:DNA-binding response OmpR family regulator